MAAKDYLFDPDRNPLFRDDYRPAEYRIPEAALRFELDDEKTVVVSDLLVERNPKSLLAGGPLVLNGEDLKLTALEIEDGTGWRALDASEYLVNATHLILKAPPAQPFRLRVATEINPSENTSLSGLYKSGDLLTTQCEAQGFRRISYFLDRPDNLTKFDVTVVGDKQKYPILLSNGNNADYAKTRDLGDGRHSASWSDPWPKPSYLFALVAGDMKVLEDSFITKSGKKVDLRIFVQEGYEDKIDWAMESVKRSMKWDEDRYGREYDLDCFHVVATDKFNAGAMENKGLNIFNVKLLVGSPETSTDKELVDIEAVIGHEYFHNWTGNRVTVRDWFELTLKEGLTVLRDRQFTADMHSAPIKTIDDATDLRAVQFMEDAGPTAHPIRPDRVEAFENIYTGTIYEKGSHVLGMLHTMMGEATWRAATDEYFNRFDGQAVACDDFIDVMQEISGIDLTQFRLWYSQAGTPDVSYSGHYDAPSKTYSLTLSQKTAPTNGQPDKQALHIPVAVGLIGQSGKDVPLTLEGGAAAAETTKVLHLTKDSQTFVFENVDGPVVPSILRGFSAPVRIVTEPSNDELMFRMSHDSDGFNRFEATERLMIKTLHGLIRDYAKGIEMELPTAFMTAYLQNLENALDGDKAYNARLLQLPAYNILIQGLSPLDPDAVSAATHFMRKTLAESFTTHFKEIHDLTRAPANEAYQVTPAQTGRRELHNLALGFLAALGTPEAEMTAQAQYAAAGNMTEKLAALQQAARFPTAAARQLADDFYAAYKDNNNIVDKWLALQATTYTGAAAVAHVRATMGHPAFDITNPNKVRALIGSFAASNHTAFHNTDGSGYKFLADVVIELNDINPKIAAGLAGRFGQFKRYDSARQQLMLAQMKRIMETPNLDAGIKEIVGQALQTAAPAKAAARDFKKTA